ncbi:MAG: VOC family protein [Dehalococcoidia bacterium]|jgi:catechol 2,3-dioxygenase-like lactoylglutathione lyase family enzyme|nr:VOC family protein [Dehalococcoidia bacterium]
MAYAINHIHLKSNDPKTSADWWVQAFGFTIASDTVRPVGDRFIAMDSPNGVRVNISEALPSAGPLAPGDAGVHEGLEHFGLDSEDIEADIERLTALGTEVLQGPTEIGSLRVCFLRGPDNVRIELIQRL